ncbi:MAG: hypothetical protein KZQ58_07125 [gamma proteobacterium symbiont of Bathyaustriella thionipta]|nr:hypothetical protein [gamma proteobacterium symbiont of Bathyaustriella thionipta]
MDKLILAPLDAGAQVNIERLIAALQEAGFIGEPLAAADEAAAWRIGERFLQLLAFMGCSPHIEVSPPADGSFDFCYVQLSGPHADIQLRTARNTAPPRCPACRYRIADWKALLHGQQSVNSAYVCAQCATRSQWYDLDWRQSAGSGRLFLEVTQIFPSEAIPGDELLALLRSVTKIPWRYFYLQE